MLDFTLLCDIQSFKSCIKGQHNFIIEIVSCQRDVNVVYR